MKTSVSGSSLSYSSSLSTETKLISRLPRKKTNQEARSVSSSD